MATRKKGPTTVSEFVVYVVFPTGGKEYVYKCNLPNIVQGSVVVANGTQVRVVRTGDHDERATRFVQGLEAVEKEERMKELLKELNSIAVREEALIRFGKLKTPHAKIMLAELKKLMGVK